MDIVVATTSPELGRLLADVLAQDGHAVEVTSSGRAAVQSFLSSIPDLAIVDVRLPDVGGMDVVRALRRCDGGARVPVVLLADDVGPTRAIGASLGVGHVLAKPPSLLDLREIVARVPVHAPTQAAVIVTRNIVPVRPPPTPEPTPAAPPAHDTSVAERAQALLRLRRELVRLEKADGWTVLGVPRGASPDLVRRAGERLRERYVGLARDGGAELRTLADQMVARIEAAVADVADPLVPVPDDTGVAEGLRLIEAQDWRGADKHFSALRDARPDSAPILAHLGWARFHNPSWARDVREPDGLALAELATAFDAWLAVAWYYRAAMANARGDVATARACAERAVRIDPTAPLPQALLRALPAPAR